MAIKRLVIEGFGQIELNNCAFRRDGRIEAQCKLDKTDFKDIAAENGMLLAIDNVERVLKLPKDDTLPIALVYTTEHMYDERANALKNFHTTLDDFMPRLGYLAKYDKYTTNCIGYDDGEFTDDEAVVAALDAIADTPVYATYCENGCHKLTKTKPEGIAIKVIKKTTMPDGQLGVKLQVLDC
nr:MAG TPA: hypothetical protein [Caudoviricetes sp.]